MLFLQTPELNPLPADSTNVVASSEKVQSTLDLLTGMNSKELVTYLSTTAISFLGDVLICIVIYYVGKFIARYIDRLLNKVFTKRNVEISIAKFARNVVKAIIYIGIIFAILSQLGIQTTSFLAIFASVGVGIGMAMSGTLQNFAGGVMVLLTRPFKIGDYVQMQGVEGTIKEIRLFNTTINTVDNKMIIIPNGGIINNIINNYSAENLRRVDWKFNATYGDDFDTAKSTIESLLHADIRVLATPAPLIALSSLSNNSIEITVRAWTKAENYWDLFFEMNEKIYKTLPTKGINFYYPHMNITVKQ